MFRYCLAAFAALFAALFAVPSFAQDVDAMNSYVEAQAETGAFMGAVLVAKDGEVLLDQGYGAASLEWRVPNGGDVKYRIGSVTKQFTAASILLLQERGQLSLDAPISRYLDDTPKIWQPVTVRQLLTHTSGIPNMTAFEDFATIKMLPATGASLIARFRDEPLDFVPGSKFSYSNSGYLLLSAIVENVSGKTYAAFLQQHIFNPLGMTDSGVADNTSVIARHASGYAPGPGGPQRAEYSNLDIPQGAGAIYSTTRDLLKWQRGLFGGAILSGASLGQYVTPALDNYALGIFLRKTAAGTTYIHSGGIEGFNSWLGYDPERRITVAVLGNLNGQAPMEIGAAMMGIAQGGQLAVPVPIQEVQIAPGELIQYEGTYAIAPTFKLKFWVDEAWLMTQATNQSAFPVIAQGDDRFFLKAVDARLVFNRDGDGQIVSVTLHQNGNSMEAQKE